ncbi:RNA-directed DNA polymerase from mobile element jockey [Plakobranchus ocellatus]|uniref:RNA-directed DNA polymerase from mobile element jockey n=1 Tax=Plakobranchus ocellatus TaxID=259542 RepID=A0AAV4AMT9_9GAST|nr:RNA-directed DNA polymerase from mobile element jockey [Plakobranchus ocellatus]
MATKYEGIRRAAQLGILRRMDIKGQRLRNGKRTKSMRSKLEGHGMNSHANLRFCSTECPGVFTLRHTELRTVLIRIRKVLARKTLLLTYLHLRGDLHRKFGLKGGLLNLFYLSACLTWRTGELPHAWRRVNLVPILKQGRCTTAAKSYRPKSLTSVISKTMEPMMNARLYHYLEQSACLDKFQSGSRRQTTVNQFVHFTQTVINLTHSKQSPTL